MKILRKTTMSVLICSLLLTSCAEGADITNTSVNPIGIEEQIQIIYDNYDTWKLQPVDDSYFSEENELNCASFAVTDLDNDGMLEIINSGWAGTSHNTFNAIYEVSEEGGLVLITEEWESPDLWNMDTVRYYTDDAGCRWNLVTNMTTEYSMGIPRYVAYLRLSIDNGFVTEPYCAEYYDLELNEETGEDGSVCRYYDADDNELTQEEFEQLNSEYDDLVEGENALGWISALEGQPSIEQLTESYQTFN